MMRPLFMPAEPALPPAMPTTVWTFGFAVMARAAARCFSDMDSNEMSDAASVLPMRMPVSSPEVNPFGAIENRYAVAASMSTKLRMTRRWRPSVHSSVRA